MSNVDLDNTNPLENLYDDFTRILNQVVIKFQVKAEMYETMETKALADQYIAAINKKDSYFSYTDYTIDDVKAAGFEHSIILLDLIRQGRYTEVPQMYREGLMQVRRQNVIDDFEEQNEYYRCLNGYPPLDRGPELWYYVPEDIARTYGINSDIPIHKIQDYYNKITPGRGDYFIYALEGLGVLDKLYEEHPYDEYIKYIGSRRISIELARKAKNFEILYMNQGVLKSIEYEEFNRIYEECRLYFMTVIYQREHRKVIEYYDNFIGMCIMIMTIWHLVMRAMPLGINREFFRDQGVRMLYEAYGVPYDMSIDEVQQKEIVQNLNLLIQNKATNQCLFDICDLLSFSRISIYKYYLCKMQKYDIYGAPIMAQKEKFNNDTGEIDTVPDYESMYDVFFQKLELNDDNFIESFYSNTNRESYESITTGDPFWWEDSKLYKELWETQFNYVETKYISLGINYSMTEMMYECILVLKMLMQFRKEMATVTFTLPKIDPDLKVTLFDCVILLECLFCKKHHLKGEIIAIPTQVLDVIQYMQEVDNQDFVVDAFGFDFDLLRPGNKEGQKVLQDVMDTLNEGDSKKFQEYLSILSINSGVSNEEKVKVFNQMFKNIRGLSDWISYKLSETDNRAEYEALKNFYRTAYYAREMKSIFTIYQEEDSGNGDGQPGRTAFTYFEYLYHINPKLYASLFKVDLENQYLKYVEEHKLDKDTFTLEKFNEKIRLGEIQISYDTLNTGNQDIIVNENMLYYYIDHVIFKMEEYIEDIDMLYLRNDTETPLEALLIKMIKFFKSLTVDLLGLDIIFICDFKNENILRLFDEIPYMKKLIQVREHYNMKLSDVVSRIIAEYREKDTLCLRDMLTLVAYLYCIDRVDLLFGGDVAFHVEKYLQAGDKNEDSIKLYDTAHIEADVYGKDALKLTDKIVAKWYSD